MNICIAGAGAIGCTLAARLANAGQTVNVLARGETLEAIQNNGITLTDIDGKYNVKVNASSSAQEARSTRPYFYLHKSTSNPHYVGAH
ncbi:ketopantoate reductase family protein [Marinomonas sp. GJ51-6]|uniref:ketopantoate reductase family protein n=1 Tax=Marinomonas sp. GJ51-6 TaxID=2992802 RepID=UPI0039774369